MEGVMREVEECRIPSEACEPATICGEGPKQGYPCGGKLRRFYYRCQNSFHLDYSNPAFLKIQ